MSTPFGAQSAWRQLVDLIGRRRVPASMGALAKLKAIRRHVPPPVRAASARAVAFADPPAALVQLFAEDELSIAAPVLRSARLRSDEWIAMLPAMSPAVRSLLRHRRDLPPAVNRALESFGSVDFVLSAGNAEGMVPSVDVEGSAPVEAAAEPVEREAPAPVVAEEPAPVEPSIESVDSAEPASVEAAPIDWTEVVGPLSPNEPEALVEPGIAAAAQEAPIVTDPAILLPPESTFVSIASVALGLPVVAEALRHNGAAAEEAATASESEPPEVEQADTSRAAEPESVAPLAEVTMLQPPPAEAASGMFQIAELVARIDAYQRQREESPTVPLVPSEIQPELFDLEPVQSQSFRFETDASGTVRWIEGTARAPLIGLSLDLAALPSGSQVDGVAAGAFRRRAGFANARLVVDGNSDAAGQWRITGIPVFDRETGRFTGYRGSARRPRPDESAEPVQGGRSPASDALRQLVHELLTPTNAIAGFAEMIETQLLG
uniref:hypothetical protein n=1 Tax=Sphingomonas bacterium TaxID=1895847 RepID=UPI00262B624D